MPTVTTRTFRSGNSQAVRLPKEIAYEDGVELEIVRTGDVVTMYPKRERKRTITEFLQALAALPKPSSVEIRDLEDLPERPGLTD